MDLTKPIPEAKQLLIEAIQDMSDGEFVSFIEFLAEECPIRLATE